MENLPEDRLTRPGKSLSRFAAVVIGGSAGGIKAVTTIISGLPAGFPLPVIVVLHQFPGERMYWPEYLSTHTSLIAVEAEDKMSLLAGRVHCAPAGYHLLVEKDGSLALSVDEKVNYARPSIDLLFTSAAEAFRERLIAIILTGANRDGAEGLAEIVGSGGAAIIQSPDTAEWTEMPLAAITAAPEAMIVELGAIARKTVELVSGR